MYFRGIILRQHLYELEIFTYNKVRPSIVAGGRNMQLNQLEYLLALSREGSYQKAAKRLHVSQSTISMAIKNLEDELDYLLVQRSNKGISFTEKGKLVLEKAVEIESDIQELLNLKNTFLSEIAGKFFIAGSSHYYNLQLVSLIIKLQERYPRLQICLEDNNNLDIIREVAQKACLMGLVQLNSIDEIFYLSEIEKYNLIFELVEQENMYFVVGPKHPFYQAEGVTLEDFLRYSVIISRYQMSEIFSNYLRTNGYQGRIVILHDIYASRNLVENSDFCAMLIPEFGTFFDNSIYKQNLKTVSIKNFSCNYKIGWVYRKNGYSERENKTVHLVQREWTKMMKEVRTLQ